MLLASVSLPGSNDVPGFWPAVWSMGNLGEYAFRFSKKIFIMNPISLGRCGYGASLDGMVCERLPLRSHLLIYPYSGRTHATLVMSVLPQIKPSMAFLSLLLRAETLTLMANCPTFPDSVFHDVHAQVNPIQARCILMAPTSAVPPQKSMSLKPRYVSILPSNTHTQPFHHFRYNTALRLYLSPLSGG